jgi:hypothetical protein
MQEKEPFLTVFLARVLAAVGSIGRAASPPAAQVILSTPRFHFLDPLYAGPAIGAHFFRAVVVLPACAEVPRTATATTTMRVTTDSRRTIGDLHFFRRGLQLHGLMTACQAELSYSEPLARRRHELDEIAAEVRG